VSAELGAVGDHYIVRQHYVVTEVAVGHEQDAVADFSDPRPDAGAGVYRRAVPDGDFAADADGAGATQSVLG